MSMGNCSQSAYNTIQFDLFVKSDGAATSDLRLNAVQYGINFNTGILKAGAAISISYVNGTTDFSWLEGYNFNFSFSDHIRIMQDIYTGGNTDSTMIIGHDYRVELFY